MCLKQGKNHLISWCCTLFVCMDSFHPRDGDRGLFIYLKFSVLQRCSKLQSFQFPDPSTQHRVQQKSVHSSGFTVVGFIHVYSCLCERRPGSGGIVPVRPSPSSRIAEGWYCFWFWTISDGAITEEIQKAAKSCQCLRCHALQHCWGSLLVKKMSWSRKLWPSGDASSH